MSELALVMLPCWEITTPPLGVGYLAEYLRFNGQPCCIHDLNCQAYAESDRKELWEAPLHMYWVDRELFVSETLPALEGFLDHWARELAADDVLAVGFSMNAASRLFGIELARRIKDLRPDRYLIWGGPGVHSKLETAYKAHLPPDLADCVVMGEGEEILLEIVTCLSAGEPVPKDLSGTAFPEGRSFRFNEPRPEIRDLDSLPFPTYDGFPLEHYSAVMAVPILMSRGCPMRCAFCDTATRIRHFRSRSALNIMQEIIFHTTRRPVYTLAFHDASMNGNIRILSQLVDMLNELPLDLSWNGNMVVHRKATRELYQSMASAGCKRLIYGVESGSDKVLGLMNKHYESDQAAAVLRWGHEAGIENHVNFICGFPGETEEDFQQTLSFVEQNRENIDAILAVTLMYFTHDSPVFFKRQELGVTLNPRGHFYWHDESGNTLEVRVDRAKRLLALARRLEIPVMTSSLNEVEIDYREEETEPRPAAELNDSEIQITDCLFLDSDGVERTTYETGESMVFVMRFRAARPVCDPLFRVQIFNEHDPTGGNLFVFGSNTARADVEVGLLPEGAGEARLVFDELNLTPSVYRLTAGVWPDESAETPYDVKHGEVVFSVQGSDDDEGARAHIPVSIAGPDGGGEIGEDLVLTDGDGRAGRGFHTREELRVHLRSLSQEPPWLTVTIRWGKLAVHCERVELGETSLVLSYAPLNLLAGDYELEVAQEGQKTLRTSFQVSSEASAGAGLVFSPCRWEIVKP